MDYILRQNLGHKHFHSRHEIGLDVRNRQDVVLSTIFLAQIVVVEYGSGGRGAADVENDAVAVQQMELGGITVALYAGSSFECTGELSLWKDGNNRHQGPLRFLEFANGVSAHHELTSNIDMIRVEGGTGRTWHKRLFVVEYSHEIGF